MSGFASYRAPMSTQDARRWARIGVLAALAVVIGWVETFIPLPLPIAGVKLGLANIVVLVTLQLIDVRAAALVALVKVLAAGFLFGNPLMMLFSAMGTLLAFAVMVVLLRVPGLHVAVVSAAAAMAHNMGQLAVAQLVLGTPLVWYSAPFMLLAACLTGSLCGFAAAWTLDALGPEAHMDAANSLQGSARATRGDALEHAPSALPVRESGVDIRIKLLALVAFFIFAFHANSPVGLGAVALIAIVSALVTRLNPTTILRLLLPLAFVLAVTVLMQLAYHQNGTVVEQVGPLVVTSEGLWQAFRMVVVQVSVVIASVSFMQSANPTELVRAFGWMLRPLERLGVNTQGAVLSLTVSMAFIPVLVREVSTLRSAHASRGVDFDGPLRLRLAAYTRLFAPLVRSAFRHADSLADSFLSRAL